MTPKQKQVLKFIDDFIRENKYSPTHQEITNEVGNNNRQNSTEIINRLCKQGYLAKMMVPLRNIVIITKGRAILKKGSKNGIRIPTKTKT